MRISSSNWLELIKCYCHLHLAICFPRPQLKRANGKKQEAKITLTLRFIREKYYPIFNP